MKEWVVYTDGATSNNGKKNASGGIGIFFNDNNPDNLGLRLNLKPITNNICELEACRKAIIIITSKKEFDLEDNIIIGTDSKYVINSISLWCSNWEKNNWKNTKKETIKNLNIIKNLRGLYLKYNIIFKYIKAHQKQPEKDDLENYRDWYGNYMADKLSRV